MKRYFQTLPAGPLDLVGDVHGELGALRDLMRHLGYGPRGEHADGRRLVFMGDLADRGPDSPGVVALVRDLVERDRARCVAGNHELNVLREEQKDGNGWAFEDDHDRAEGHFLDSRRASAAERAGLREFFAQLPLTLEREDLRLTHACWSPEAVERLSALPAHSTLVTAFADYEADTERRLQESGLAAAVAEAKARHRQALRDRERPMELIDAIARADELQQMNNPIRVLTSGVERYAQAPFFSSGKWRFVDRVPWWQEYHGAVPVVVGHYWRWPVAVDRKEMDKEGPDLFHGTEPSHWLGARGNVYCVDFSVGRRFVDRQAGRPEGATNKLAALRWDSDGPTLVFDDGARQRLQPAG